MRHRNQLASEPDFESRLFKGHRGAGRTAACSHRLKNNNPHPRQQPKASKPLKRSHSHGVCEVRSTPSPRIMRAHDDLSSTHSLLCVLSSRVLTQAELSSHRLCQEPGHSPPAGEPGKPEARQGRQTIALARTSRGSTACCEGSMLTPLLRCEAGQALAELGPKKDARLIHTCPSLTCTNCNTGGPIPVVLTTRHLVYTRMLLRKAAATRSGALTDTRRPPGGHMAPSPAAPDPEYQPKLSILMQGSWRNPSRCCKSESRCKLSTAPGARGLGCDDRARRSVPREAAAARSLPTALSTSKVQYTAAAGGPASAWPAGTGRPSDATASGDPKVRAAAGPQAREPLASAPDDAPPASSCSAHGGIGARRRGAKARMQPCQESGRRAARVADGSSRHGCSHDRLATASGCSKHRAQAAGGSRRCAEVKVFHEPGTCGLGQRWPPRSRYLWYSKGAGHKEPAPHATGAMRLACIHTATCCAARAVPLPLSSTARRRSMVLYLRCWGGDQNARGLPAGGYKRTRRAAAPTGAAAQGGEHRAERSSFGGVRAPRGCVQASPIVVPLSDSARVCHWGRGPQYRSCGYCLPVRPADASCTSGSTLSATHTRPTGGRLDSGRKPPPLPTHATAP